MVTWAKVTLSIVGIFLGGVATTYQSTPAGPWMAWVMGGLAPTGAYLIGFHQLNPALRARRKGV